jgi:hypothetical protein
MLSSFAVLWSITWPSSLFDSITALPLPLPNFATFSRCTTVDLTHLFALPAGILPEGHRPFAWQIDRPACENKWSVFRAPSGARCDHEKEGMKGVENVMILQRLIDKRAVCCTRRARCGQSKSRCASKSLAVRKKSLNERGAGLRSATSPTFDPP